MWKHVLVAANFGHAWGQVVGVPDIEQAATVATTVSTHFSSVADSGAGVTGGAGTAAAVAGVGVSGTLSFNSSNPDDFIASATANQLMLEHWLAGLVNLPTGNVQVVIPPPVTTTPEPVGPSGGPVVNRLLQDDPDEVGSAVEENPVPVPESSDPAPQQIDTTFTITLPPGKVEIAQRLTATPPADQLTAFQAQLPAGLVSSAAITLTASTATAIPGSVLLAVSDTTTIESQASQEGVRNAIAALAGVWFGDVSDITFTSADGNPIPAEPPADDSGVRRLTAGSVNAGFSISVPGRAAQGYVKDCSLQRLQVGDMPPAADLANLFTTVGDAGTPVTSALCTTEANRRQSQVWSFTATPDPAAPADPEPDQCRVATTEYLSGATYNANAVTQFQWGGAACGDCPTVNPDESFPGADSATSNAAFANSQQPLNLQCWPKNLANTQTPLMPCGSTVVESTANGWLGACNNLEADPTATTPELCREHCQADPFCSVWEWGTPAGGVAACFRGVGNACWTLAAGQDAVTERTSERIQHGLVNVLASYNATLNRVISGLQMQFAENVAATGLLGNETAQRDACRLICHSNILCTFWQSYYSNGERGDLGCWTEAPGVDAQGGGVNAGAMVPYPFTTTDGYDEDDGDEQYITGGEFIQHYCPVPTLPTRPPTTTTTTTTIVVEAAAVNTPAPESGGFMNPWGYLLIAGGLLCGLGAIALMVTGGNKKPPTKKGSRAVKPMKTKPAEQPPPPAPPPPQQPVVPLMAQQVLVQPTIPQPLAMTTIPTSTVAAQAVAQPVQFQSVQPTYAAAPQLAAPQLLQSVARPY